MDVVVVKNEFKGRRGAAAADLGGEGVQCVKRRRRERTLPPPAVDGSGEAVDQSAAAAGGTIKRSSRFRGVSRHRWTGRYEAHLWDKASWNPTQRKKGKQVYLGAYDEEESAARAYDLAALKYWGATTFTNFPVVDYEKEIQIMQHVTKEEYLATLRRKSSGFSRGVSKYRGVARHHHNGRWEARIGRVFGNKYLYLGTYSTQEDAAHAYDIAAIEYRGINAVTNFDLSTYIRWLRTGANNGNGAQVNNGIGDAPQATHAPTNHHLLSSEADPFAPRNNFINDNIEPQYTQEFVSQRTPAISGDFSSKSPPTALGLLFRSSMFRQLVESNSSASDEEIYGEDIKNRRQQMGVDGEQQCRIPYMGIPGVPYCSSDGVTVAAPPTSAVRNLYEMVL